MLEFDVQPMYSLGVPVSLINTISLFIPQKKKKSYNK